MTQKLILWSSFLLSNSIIMRQRFFIISMLILITQYEFFFIFRRNVDVHSCSEIELVDCKYQREREVLTKYNLLMTQSVSACGRRQATRTAELIKRNIEWFSINDMEKYI